LFFPVFPIQMISIIKHKNSLKYFEPFIITFFWVLLFASPLLLGQFENNIDWAHVFKIWKEYLPLLLLFFINRFVLLPKLFFRNKRMLFVISVSSLIVLLAAGSYLYYTKFSPRVERSPPKEAVFNHPPFQNQSSPPYPPPPPPGRRDNFKPPMQPNPQPAPIPPYANLFILSVLIVGFDTGLKVSVIWAQTEQERIKLEKENVENQLAFLRNQVSPHFFMNTLNNIHALIDLDTEEAKESIIKLSKLMRHLLYESEVEMSPIRKEVEFVKSYINLMKLRFSDKVKISLQIPGQLPDKSIPPLLFTSLLENAFKHGISYHNESFIHIELSFTEDKLRFEIRNSNPKYESDDSASGIGIENTRKRLDLIYKDNYTLDIIDIENVFIVNLSIPI